MIIRAPHTHIQYIATWINFDVGINIFIHKIWKKCSVVIKLIPAFITQMLGMLFRRLLLHNVPNICIINMAYQPIVRNV